MRRERIHSLGCSLLFGSSFVFYGACSEGGSADDSMSSTGSAEGQDEGGTGSDSSGDDGDGSGGASGGTQTSQGNDDSDSDSSATTHDSSGPDSGGEDSGAEQAKWEFEDIFGVPNLDDDDENGRRDWDAGFWSEDDDYSKLSVNSTQRGEVGVDGGFRVELVERSMSKIRIWHEGQQILRDGSMDFDAGSDAIEFDIEFSDFNADGTLTLSKLDDAGEVVEETSIALRSSPLIANHHLQLAEQVWAVGIPTSFWGTGNEAMTDVFEEVLGSRMTVVPAASVEYDVWIQDEFEFSTASGNDGERLDIVVDSIRDRGLDRYGRELVQPGQIRETWGEGASPTTYDSFGNLEVTPPVEVDGVSYPMGRIYYGKKGGDGVNGQLTTFLSEQRIQKPFEIDTTWLCVGHIDEFTAFLPDPGSEKGFKFVYADVDAGYELLQSIDPATRIPKYQAEYGYATVGDILADNALRQLNQDLQSDFLDPYLEIFKREAGLEESDIVRIPSLFEHAGEPGENCVAALIPGMVNVAVAQIDDTSPHVFVPDPFMRANRASQDQDAVIQDFRDRVPDGLNLHFVDAWDHYHIMLGEVHCGSNVKRSPAEAWWDKAMHLLEGE